VSLGSLWRQLAGPLDMGARWAYLADALRFAARLLAMATDRRAYNPAVRDIVERQIYFTAWEVLPRLAAFGALLTWMVAHIAARVSQPFGLQLAAAEMVLRVVTLEGLPLIVALFLALRSGAAMNAEVALMSERGEAAAWQRLGLDPEQLEYMPRLVGGVVSMLALTLLCVVVSIGVLFLNLQLSSAWQLVGRDVQQMLAGVLSLNNLAVLVLKSAVFGVVITVLPLFEGQRTPRMPHMVPVSVLRGMVRVFVGVMLTWLLGLALVYL
jgi:phospholipid/cholesterol/gamma-HCH transport system permease protein